MYISAQVRRLAMHRRSAVGAEAPDHASEGARSELRSEEEAAKSARARVHTWGPMRGRAQEKSTVDDN